MEYSIKKVHLTKSERERIVRRKDQVKKGETINVVNLKVDDIL
jgi:hypothetical protein